MTTLLNPSGQPARVACSDGVERTVPAWGLLVLPDGVRRAADAPSPPGGAITSVLHKAAD